MLDDKCEIMFSYNKKLVKLDNVNISSIIYVIVCVFQFFQIALSILLARYIIYQYAKNND